MPELAEVEYFRKRWNPGLGSQVMAVSAQVSRPLRDTSPRQLAGLLTGQHLTSSSRHGKQMLFHFSSKTWLGIHLGMTGECLVAPSGTKPEKHDLLTLQQKGRVLVFRDPRRFGRVRLHRGESQPAWWDPSRPEPHSKAFTRVHFDNILSRHTRRPLKALLLDQRHFPGIGNWMADEILWKSSLPPAITTAELSLKDRAALYRELRRVCRDALRVIGKDWGDPPDSWLFNHRWADGGTCPRCHQGLTRDQIGGRTTCWCPDCQRT